MGHDRSNLAQHNCMCMWCRKCKVKVAQSCLTLQPHGLYSPWTTPGQNTGVDSLSLLQGICSSGTELGSPSLQVDSLPNELSGKPMWCRGMCQRSNQLGHVDRKSWEELSALGCLRASWAVNLRDGNNSCSLHVLSHFSRVRCCDHGL